MSILRIKNRTENWKTACRFFPLFRDKDARLRLAKRLGESGDTKPDQVHFEMFWYGMRDYLKVKRGPNKQYFPDLARRYENLFPDLRKKVEGFIDPRRFHLKLKDHHYSPSGKEGATLLGNNLIYTEIDVVLETPSNLFIGEAKDESGFDAKSRYVLVHQLIREFVMANILVKQRVSEGCVPKKTVIPFVVRNELKGREQAQVEFMVKQDWLPKGNILGWEDIENLACNS